MSDQLLDELHRCRIYAQQHALTVAEMWISARLHELENEMEEDERDER